MSNTDDFRLSRSMLPPEAFALGPDEPDPPPTDLVPENVWQSFVTLPDDVSLRTSAYQGSMMKDVNDIWSSWIEKTAEHKKGDAVHFVMLHCFDEVSAARFNALCGFYRQAFGCLRNIVELATIGSLGQLAKWSKEFEEWKKGNRRLSFGYACDGLLSASETHAIRDHLKKNLSSGDSFFAQKSGGFSGGWARRLFDSLSEFAHSRPDYNNFAFWNSNGPVYVPKAFHKFVVMLIETVTYSYLLFKQVKPSFILPDNMKDILDKPYLKPNKIAVVAYMFLEGITP